MTKLAQAVEAILRSQRKSGKPLAVILAGHNGSGKSTMWYDHLAERFQIPLVNADRMMMSILPEVRPDREFPAWAATIRDQHPSWMHVAQKGVEAFVAQAMAKKVPFAMETVFSHWKETSPGQFESKIDLIRQLQDKGYFVLLLFVGLTSDALSIARVSTRVANGGHNVAVEKLVSRFPRTQQAIRLAVPIVDAAILADNSRSPGEAFTVCHIQLAARKIYDWRDEPGNVPPAIQKWLDVICPLQC